MVALPLAALCLVALLWLRSPARTASPANPASAFSIRSEGDLLVVRTPAGETWVRHARRPASTPGTILIHMGNTHMGNTHMGDSK
jgi:hypothetical protein